jgi:NAD(P)-dependent dehydrogenase (short-subunit alcohol dehydrogenase family)
MPDRLKDKVALVVGAGSIGPGWGNGKATAVAFAREGAKVFCVDVNPKAAEETAEIIAKEGGAAQTFRADVTKQDDVVAMIEACRKAYGRIDVLDYNVGIAEVGGTVELPEELWDRSFNVNLKGAFFTFKHVLPMMVAQGGGSIITISSVAAVRYTGVPYVAYNATKAALSHLTRTTAVEYAPKKIRCNTILPGLMETPMVANTAGLVNSYAGGDIEEMWRVRAKQVPMGFGGSGWDIAWAAVFLASDESRYITGLDMIVDGGLTLKYA